jgi:hypothetical protein
MQERAKALALAKAGNRAKAEDALQLCVTKARELPPYNRGLMVSLVDLGRIQQERKQPSKAARSYAEAIRLADKYTEEVRDFHLEFSNVRYSYGGNSAFYGFHISQIYPICKQLFAEAGKPEESPTINAALLKFGSSNPSPATPVLPGSAHSAMRSRYWAIIITKGKDALKDLTSFIDFALIKE